MIAAACLPALLPGLHVCLYQKHIISIAKFRNYLFCLTFGEVCLLACWLDGCWNGAGIFAFHHLDIFIVDGYVETN